MSSDAERVAPHFLFVGDSTDVPTLRTLLAKLPVDSYGQVFVEVASAVQIQRIPSPAGVTTTWLVRDGHGSGRRMAPRGERVVRLVEAWLAEWMTADADAPRVIWIGCAASPRVGRLHRDLRARYALEPRHPLAATTAAVAAHDHPRDEAERGRTP